MKKSSGSKNSKHFYNTEKKPYLQSPGKEKLTKDDEQEGMINKKYVQDIGKNQGKQSHKPKYYHIINPNLNESEYEDENEEKRCADFRQLTLKNLIIFLLLLSVLMLGTYKMIEQIYQIEHPQEMISRRMNQKRMSMQKQGSTVGKQQMKAQTQKELLNSKGLKQVPNKLQATQKRFRQKVEATNNEEKQQGTELNVASGAQHQIHQENHQNTITQKSSQNQEQKQPDENDSALKEKQQDIIQSLSNINQQSNPQIQNPQTPLPSGSTSQSKSIINENIHQATLIDENKNPIIQNAGKYLWNTFSADPIPKANITKAQAIQWKSYVKMIQLPLGTHCMDQNMLWEEYSYFENKYQISQYKQLPICVVVPSFNNAQNDRYKVNIQSILQQNYSNYHIVLIDDKSDDRTGQLVREYLSYFQPKYQDKLKLIINQERKMAMPNLRYAAMHECHENQLFIIIDGDDSLIGRQVFKLFSAVMQKRDLWVMWTNFLSPKGSIGYSRQYPQIHRNSNNYRKAGFVMSHLRAYYTKLFRLIKEEDLKDENGEYLHAANDVAIGIPILEMAHMRTGYVPEISYFYNMNTGLNNHRVRLREQKNNDKKIRKKPKYNPLPSLDFSGETKYAQQEQIAEQLVSQEKKEIEPIKIVQKQQDMYQMEYNLHRKVNEVYIIKKDTQINN